MKSIHRRAAAPAHRHQYVEALEPRRLLSAYTLNTLAAFNNFSDAGTIPYSGVVLDSSGDLFGTAIQAGNDSGDVFELAHGGASIVALASFNGGNGAQPQGVTLDSSGDLFGATNAGGAAGAGAVFEIAHGSTSVTTLVSFNSANGSSPAAGVILDSSGDLFGTTQNGGANSDGTAFEIVHGSTSVTTLVNFNSTNGANPTAGPILGADGSIFGTTEYGGASNDGTVFELASGSTALTTLASFNAADGSYPYSGVTLDSSGNLFGATENGGANSDGTVFEIASGSTALTTLASFTGANGQYPWGGVTLDSSDNVFGTTSAGGAYDDGTIYQISSAAKSITTLATFNYTNGAFPSVALTLDSSGNLFGAAVSGGADNDGTVFEMSPITAGPGATIAASDVTSVGAKEAIAVSYSDSGSPIDSSTIAASNLTVTSSSGASLPITLLSTSAAGNAITANYSVAPADGAFAAADNGLYTITVVAGSVRDQQGNAVPATIDAFAVKLPTTPQDLSAALVGPVSPSTVATTPLKLKDQLTLSASSAVSGAFSAKIVLSPDESAADSVLTLSSVHGKLSLKAGKARSFVLSLPRSIPDGIAAGTYNVLIELTDTTGVTATLASGQTLLVVAPVVHLAATSVALSPTSPAAGKKFKITVLVTNASGASVSAVGLLPFELETSADGQLSDAAVLTSGKKHINLKPGKSLKFTVTATIASSGSTNLIVNLDPSHTAFANDISAGDEIHVQQIAVS